MGVLRNLRNILPIPRNWKDEEHHFGLRVNNAITELFAKDDKLDKKDEELAKEIEGLSSSKSDRLWLQSTDNTWAKIWAKIGKMEVGDVATCYAHGNAMSVISSGARTSGQNGTIARGSNTVFYFLFRSASTGNSMLTCYITGCSESTPGTYSEKYFDPSDLANRTKWYFTNTSGTTQTKENAIHAFIATVRSSMSSGEIANYAYYDGTTFYAGEIVKVSSKAYRGRLFTNDKSGGFYINDSSDNASATITLFGESGQLPTNTNLNNIKNSSIYILSSSSNYTNAPAAYGILEVIVPTANRVVQRLTLTNRMYWRYFDGTNWYNWRQVTNTEVT